MATSLLGKVILRFYGWVRKLVMTVQKVQLHSVLSLVGNMRLIGMASLVGHSATLKMSRSFQYSLTRLCYGVRKMCGVKRAIQDGSWMTKLLHSSLFMAFMTASSFYVMDGLFLCCQ